MTGIAEVAARAGVSKSTASRALTGGGYVSPATKDRVAQAAAELGYVPSSSAVNLATGRTNTVGVIVPDTSSWWSGAVIEGVHSALLSRGLELSLYTAAPSSVERERMFDTFLGGRRFDGLITVGVEPAFHEMERIIAVGMPVVSMGGYDAGTSGVSIDDVLAGRVATEHLISLGHTRIAFLGGTLDREADFVAETARRGGYEQALTDAGLSEFARQVPAATNMPAGYDEGVHLLSDSRARPTAIVASCDEVAIGAIIAARRMGLRVPTDLSVIGIDDHTYADMFALTTIRQSPKDQAETAVALLVEHIDNPDAPPRRVSADARLVVRNSTAIAPE